MVDNARRAATAYAAMQSFYQPRGKLYRERYPYDATQDQPNGYVWSFEEATRATLYLYGGPNGAAQYATAVQDRLSAREAYWDGGTRQRAYRSYPQTGDRYYDDNCWVGSDLLQHHMLTDTATTSLALERAQGVWRYIQAGWTTNVSNPGGIRWIDSSSNGDRATNSTAGSAKLGAQLYEVTDRTTPACLNAATQAYSWLEKYMLGSNGLYANAMRADGQLDTKLWIYNQGIVIGAAIVLNRVTGDARYLTDATRLADATLAVFGTDAYYSGDDGAYSGRAIFNAIFFRNLLMLYAVTHNVSHMQAMQSYANTAWSDTNVHDASGLFRLNGETRFSLLDQAAMVQVYAMLSWSADQYPRLT